MTALDTQLDRQIDRYLAMRDDDDPEADRPPIAESPRFKLLIDRLIERSPWTPRDFTSADVADFRARFPAAEDADEEQARELLSWHRNNPFGAVGPAPEESFLRSIALHPPRVAAGTVEGAVSEPAARVSQAFAALAGAFQNEPLADAFRRNADRIRREQVAQARALGLEGGAFSTGTGRLLGNLTPSAISLFASGGASAPILAYMGLQAVGGGAEEYRETMIARGATPNDVDALAVGLGYGVAEVLSEKIGLDLLGKVGDDIARKLGDAMLRGNMKQAATVIAGTAKGATIEGTEEALTQIAQNAIAGDFGFFSVGFDPDRGLGEGVAQAFGLGAAGGAILTPAAVFGPRSTLRGESGEAMSLLPDDLLATVAAGGEVMVGEQRLTPAEAAAEIERREVPRGTADFGPEQAELLTPEERTEAVTFLRKVQEGGVDLTTGQPFTDAQRADQDAFIGMLEAAGRPAVEVVPGTAPPEAGAPAPRAPAKTATEVIAERDERRRVGREIAIEIARERELAGEQRLAAQIGLDVERGVARFQAVESLKAGMRRAFEERQAPRPVEAVAPQPSPIVSERQAEAGVSGEPVISDELADRIGAIVQQREEAIQRAEVERQRAQEAQRAERRRRSEGLAAEAGRRTFVTRLEEIAKAAEARREARSKSVTLGAGLGGFQPLFADLADISIQIAARALAQGVRGASAVTQFVADFVSTQAPRFRPHADRITRQVRKLLAATDEDDPASFDRAADALRGGESKRDATASLKATISSLTGAGAKDVATVSEKAALAGSLKRQQTVARQAFSSGVAAVRAQIPAITRKLRDAAKAQLERQERQALAGNLRAQGRAARAASKEGKRIRREIIALVREKIPKGRQGRFISEIASADTDEAIQGAVAKIALVAAQAQHDDAIKDLRNAFRRYKRMRKRLREGEREQIEKLLRAAKSRAIGESGRKRTYQTPAEYDDARDEIAANVEGAFQIMALNAMERKQIIADRARTIEEHVVQIAKNVLDETLLTGRDAIVEDIERSRVRNWFGVSALDLNNLARKVERKWDGKSGVLWNLLHRLPKEALDAHGLALRAIHERLGRAVKLAGFRNVNEAFAAMDGALGDANVRRIAVTLGSRTVKLRLGEALELALLDEETVAQLDAGIGFVLNDGRSQVPIVTNAEEIAAIRDQIGPDIMRLGETMREILAEFYEPLARVKFRLTGKAPTRIAGRWPRSRNRESRIKIDLNDPRSLNMAIRDRALENAGLMEERTGGLDSLVIMGAMTRFMREADMAQRIIHLAEPIHIAGRVLTDSNVQRAIASRWGPRMNKALLAHLVAVSRVNLDASSKADRVLRGLNSALADAHLRLNERTFIRQLGGIFKLSGSAGWDTIAAGVPRIDRTTWGRMMRASGLLYQRYHLDSAARYSPVGVSGAAIERGDGWGEWFIDTKLSLRSLLGSIGQGRIGDAAITSRKALMSQLRLLDWFDFIPVAVTFEGHVAKLQKEHPDWTSQEIDKEAGRLTAANVGESVNSTDPSEGTTFAVETHNSLLRAFLLFTSEPMKSYNQLIRAFHSSPKDAARLLLGVLLNALWSFLVSSAKWTTVVGGVAGGNSLRKSLMAAKEDAVEEAGWNAAREVASLFYFADIPLQAIQGAMRPYMRDGLANAPLQESIANLVGSLTEFWLAGQLAIDGKEERALTHFLNGIEEAATSGAELMGIPFVVPYYRGRAIMREAEKQEQPAGEQG